MEGSGEECGFFRSPKLPYQQSCRRLSESQKKSYIRKKINCAHFFMLECKTTDGFLFAMFDFIMPK